LIGFNSPTMLHRHGDDWVPMQEVKHTVDDHDLERRLLRGERIFRCSQCEEQVLVGEARDQE
jgi:hypothetical protein